MRGLPTTQNKIATLLILVCIFVFIFGSMQSVKAEIEALPMHRFLNRQSKIHFYTNNVSEKNFVISNLGGAWEYEGIVFGAYDKSDTTKQPVYRFLHKQLKIHFYTASESEKNIVQSKLSNVWQYEGVVFRAYTSNGEDRVPVRRFLHKQLKIHFYTASNGEYNFVRNSLSNIWQYEGISYWVESADQFLSPSQVADNCPISTQACVPCDSSDPYCRIESGKTTGFKGWACQNNNPGNIRYSDERNAIITSNGGEAACGQRNTYMVFRDYHIGRNSLKSYIRGIANGQHSSYPECGNCSIKYFFSKYAPAGDQNDPNSYANNVAYRVGVNADTTTINWIVANKLDQFVNAIQIQEGWFTE